MTLLGSGYRSPLGVGYRSALGVRGSVACGCPVSYDLTLAGMDANILDVCLACFDRAYPGCGWSAKIPSAGGGWILVNGTYTIDFTATGSNYPLTCNYNRRFTGSFSSGGFKTLGSSICVGSSSAWTIEELRHYLFFSPAGTVTGVEVVALSVPSNNHPMLLFDSGAITADLGDPIANTLYGGVGTVTITES